MIIVKDKMATDANDVYSSTVMRNLLDPQFPRGEQTSNLKRPLL